MLHLYNLLYLWIIWFPFVKYKSSVLVRVYVFYISVFYLSIKVAIRLLQVTASYDSGPLHILSPRLVLASTGREKRPDSGHPSCISVPPALYCGGRRMYPQPQMLCSLTSNIS